MFLLMTFLLVAILASLHSNWFILSLQLFLSRKRERITSLGLWWYLSEWIGIDGVCTSLLKRLERLDRYCYLLQHLRRNYWIVLLEMGPSNASPDRRELVAELVTGAIGKFMGGTTDTGDAATFHQRVLNNADGDHCIHKSVDSLFGPLPGNYREFSRIGIQAVMRVVFGSGDQGQATSVVCNRLMGKRHDKAFTEFVLSRGGFGMPPMANCLMDLAKECCSIVTREQLLDAVLHWCQLVYRLVSISFPTMITLLCNHPPFFKELIHELKNGGATVERNTSSHLNRCVTETLRLNPHGHIQERALVGKLQLSCNNRESRTGDRALIHARYVMRNNMFFHHPDRFMPDRWRNYGSTAFMVDPFSLHLMKLLTARFLQKLDYQQERITGFHKIRDRENVPALNPFRLHFSYE